jgi:glucose-6-phosphate dehydrogenase assembly protein OpcA
MAVVDTVWSARDTTPSQIEEALRRMLMERHVETPGFVAARALNMVTIVDKQWSGEIANRLRGVGRYHASRTVVCAVEPGRTRIDARAMMAAEQDPQPGELLLLRETVIVSVGERHVPHLDTIVDPLVVSDLPTVVWSPHGHDDALEAVLPLAQIVLLDTVDEPDPHEGLQHALHLTERVYVVDLAWLRTTPWRERAAATFDPPQLRRELDTISAVTVRHHRKSAAVALLLVGWLASRLRWRVSPLIQRDRRLLGSAHAQRQDVRIALEPDPRQEVPGLAALTLETASGRWLSLERGACGLQARYRNARGDERSWTILGASRGERGILGEGIRQALLRDPTYRPALVAASSLAP